MTGHSSVSLRGRARGLRRGRRSGAAAHIGEACKDDSRHRRALCAGEPGLLQHPVRKPRTGFAGRPAARRNGAPELPARDVALGQPCGARDQDKREQHRDGGGGEQGCGRAEIVQRDGEDGDEQGQKPVPEGEAEGGLAK